MVRVVVICAALAASVSTAVALLDSKPGDAKKADDAKKGAKMPTTETKGPLDFKMIDIEGTEIDLGQYKGKVVMIVNVASRCGLTPQYKGLQALYEKHAEQGLVILGFPANNFMGQEPGSNKDIKQFCETKFGVTFPMFAKISVKGDDIHPLYAYLTSKEAGHKFGGTVEWNFGKFLVGRDGQLINRFHPRKTPDSKEIATAIEAALKQDA